jgi:hypothetical protein
VFRERSAGSTFLKLSHGYTVDVTKPDTLVELVENASKEFHTATLPGEWLIDSIPLSMFPRYIGGQLLIAPATSALPTGLVPRRALQESRQSIQGTQFRAGQSSCGLCSTTDGEWIRAFWNCDLRFSIQAAGIEVPSFTSMMLRKGLNAYEEDVVMWGANSLYGGGTDTVRILLVHTLMDS